MQNIVKGLTGQQRAADALASFDCPSKEKEIRRTKRIKRKKVETAAKEIEKD